MALPASDAFTRADGGGLGVNYTPRSNDFNIASNQAQPNATADCIVAWTADAFSSDHLSQITVVNYQSRYAGPCVRLTTSSTLNGYAWITDASGVLIGYRIDAGTFSSIFTPGTTVANGDVLKLSVTGSTLTFYKNGASVGTVATTTGGTGFTGGAAGFYGNGATILLDNFSADDNAAAGGGLPFFMQGDVRHGYKQQRSGGLQ